MSFTITFKLPILRNIDRGKICSIFPVKFDGGGTIFLSLFVEGYFKVNLIFSNGLLYFFISIILDKKETNLGGCEMALYQIIRDRKSCFHYEEDAYFILNLLRH